PASRPAFDQRVYAMAHRLSGGQLFVQTFHGRPAYPPSAEQGSASCSEQTLGDDSTARIETVRCALPRSTDKPGATAPSTHTGAPPPRRARGPPQPGPGGTPAPGGTPTAGGTPQPGPGGTPAPGGTPTAGGTPQPGGTTTTGSLPAPIAGFAYYPPGD